MRLCGNTQSSEEILNLQIFTSSQILRLKIPTRVGGEGGGSHLFSPLHVKKSKLVVYCSSQHERITSLLAARFVIDDDSAIDPRGALAPP